MGAAYSLGSQHRQDHPSELFASQAQRLLQIEMDSPVPATVQALVVLCSHEAAQGRDSRGSLHLSLMRNSLTGFDWWNRLDLFRYCLFPRKSGRLGLQVFPGMAMRMSTDLRLHILLAKNDVGENHGDYARLRRDIFSAVCCLDTLVSF
jgi:hypothetical protein